MRVRAQTVQPLTGQIVRVTFTDGTRREVELKPYLRGPIFEPIRRDTEPFRAVRVAFGALTWPNAADIDPNVLYHGGTPDWARQHDQAESA